MGGALDPGGRLGSPIEQLLRLRYALQSYTMRARCPRSQRSTPTDPRDFISSASQGGPILTNPKNFVIKSIRLQPRRHALATTEGVTHDPSCTLWMAGRPGPGELSVGIALAGCPRHAGRNLRGPRRDVRRRVRRRLWYGHRLVRVW